MNTGCIRVARRSFQLLRSVDWGKVLASRHLPSVPSDSWYPRFWLRQIFEYRKILKFAHWQWWLLSLLPWRREYAANTLRRI